MKAEQPSESHATTKRYRVRRPTRQRIAGWIALASAAAIPLSIWFATLPPEAQGPFVVIGIWFHVPFMGVLLLAALIGLFFVMSISAAVYWMAIERASDSFPWRRGRGKDGVSPYPMRGVGPYQPRREWH